MNIVHIEKINEYLIYLETLELNSSEIKYLDLIYSNVYDLDSDILLTNCEYLNMVGSIINKRLKEGGCKILDTTVELYNLLLTNESCDIPSIEISGNTTILLFGIKSMWCKNGYL